MKNKLTSLVPKTNEVGLGVGLGMVAYLFGEIHGHKDMAHQSIRLKPIAREVCRFGFFFLTGQDSRQFAVTHRWHHAKAETEEDHLSPNGRHPVVAFVSAAYDRIKAKRDITKMLQEPEAVSFGDIDNDPSLIRGAEGQLELRPHRLNWLLRKDAAGIAIGLGSLMLMTGKRRGAMIYGISAGTALTYSAYLNVSGHGPGTYPHPESTGSDGSWIGSLISGGQRDQNTHHHEPWNPRSASPGHPDLNFAIVKALEAANLAEIKAI